MQDRPTPEELLTYARQVLLDEVLPDLPAERRVTVLMIANAMAIAARAAAQGEAPLRDELASLRALYGDPPQALPTGPDLVAAVTESNARLAVDLRAGAFDAADARGRALRAHLLESACQKLRESKPKHLKAEGLA